MPSDAPAARPRPRPAPPAPDAPEPITEALRAAAADPDVPAAVRAWFDRLLAGDDAPSPECAPANGRGGVPRGIMGRRGARWTPTEQGHD